MIRSLIYSITFHSIMIILTVMSLPFMLRKQTNLPQIVPVKLIKIPKKKKTLFKLKAKKIIKKKKKKKKKK